MSLQYPDFLSSHSARSSLKRGLARQAMSDAYKANADLPRIFASVADLAPNRKAMERAVLRLKARPGVVMAGVSGDAIVLLLRNTREVLAREDAQNLFSEQALVWTRVKVFPAMPNRGSGLHILRAGFCRHAIERLVERSDVALDQPLLTAMDREAASVLKSVDREALIADSGDTFVSAIQSGVWAGRLDRSPLEEDWGLSLSDGAEAISFFSARTFLGPQEMRPTLFAQWQRDPRLSVRLA